MPFNFIIPQSPAGAVPALYYVPPNIVQYQQPPLNPPSMPTYRQNKSPSTPHVSFLHPKFKTQICNKYDPEFGCPYGEQCQFRHPEDPTPPEAVITRISQMAISEGSNSVSSNNSIGAPLPNRGGRYDGRNHFDNNREEHILFQGKSIYNSQYNSRQVLKTKGNGVASHPVRQPTKRYSVNENTSNNGNIQNNGENRSFYRQFVTKSPSTPSTFFHPKFKTMMCNKYNSKFGCPYGEQCQFRHPEDQGQSDLIMTRMSQVTISDGSNSVSSNNSVDPPLINRGGRFTGRYHIGSSGDARGFFTGKTVFRQQYHNNRQLLKTKEYTSNQLTRDVAKAPAIANGNKKNDLVSRENKFKRRQFIVCFI